MANLVLSATVTPAQPYDGQRVTYALMVSNRGPESAASVVLTGEVPAGAVVLGAAANQGVCSVVNGSLLCALGALTNGGTASATLELAFPSPGTVTVSFLTTLPDFDPDPQDNEASVQVAVIAGARIRIARTTECSSSR